MPPLKRFNLKLHGTLCLFCFHLNNYNSVWRPWIEELSLTTSLLPPPDRGNNIGQVAFVMSPPRRFSFSHLLIYYAIITTVVCNDVNITHSNEK